MNLFHDPIYLSSAIDGAYPLALLVGGWLLTAWAASIVNTRLQRSRHIDQTLRPIIVSFVRYVVFGVVAIDAEGIVIPVNAPDTRVLRAKAAE